MLRAVLFDMDGLLVDSEVVWYAVEIEIAAWLGASWGPEQQAELVGSSLERTCRYLVAHAGSDLPWQVVGERLVGTMVERLRAGVALMPGAGELLDALTAEGVTVGLVSSSQRGIVDAVLTHVGADRFAVIVTGDDITAFKPDPAPYLLALDRLGLGADDVVVLEDSPSGVASAQAAGIRVVMVPSVVRLEPAPGRTVLDSLAELDVARLRALLATSAA